MRHQDSFPLEDPDSFKGQLLEWARSYKEVLWLDSNGHRDRYSSLDGMLAADAESSFSQGSDGAFEALKKYRRTINDWLFGYLSYDLKNDIEDLESANYDGIGLPEIAFFQPRKIIRISGNTVDFLYMEAVAAMAITDFNEILQTNPQRGTKLGCKTKGLRLQLRMFKDEYFRNLGLLHQHIQRGDLYEANFCQEFFSEGTSIDPVQSFSQLNLRSAAPFSAYLRLNQWYLLSASPERFLKRKGNTIISQPMKGTARRSKDACEDELLRQQLGKDPKERAENIMIVDLVRNDLSRSALKGSVKVRELCGVYSFKEVHQMISTIEAQVVPEKDPVDIIKEAFPMGSMTGAPKVSAMKLIESLEATKRGLYSGAVGYLEPGGNFDFSVVIRSIVYHQKKRYVSFSVGSAITAASVAEKEYQECLLKARAMKEVLEGS